MIIRTHSMNGEINTIKAMIRPDFNRTKPKISSKVDPTAQVTGAAAKAILAHYHKQYCGGVNPGIPDRRITQLDEAASRFILELAKFPGFEYSDEVKSTFSKDELAVLANKLAPVTDARRELRANGNKTKKVATEVEKAAKYGLRVLLERAAIVVTTAAIATKPDFTTFRHTKFLMVDEIGR